MTQNGHGCASQHLSSAALASVKLTLKRVSAADMSYAAPSIQGSIHTWRLRACDDHPLNNKDGTGFLVAANKQRRSEVAIR
jgi:hypothetical protein